MNNIIQEVLALTASVVAVSVFCTAGTAVAEEAAGDWGGLLGGQLHVVVHVTKDADGRYGASLESPDQGAFVLPADHVDVSADRLEFSIPRISGGFDGTWDTAQKAWVGTWRQGQSIPLSLSRLAPRDRASQRLKRPQEEAIAAPPRTYGIHEVAFGNPSAKVTLAGTLTVPAGSGPFRSVVLISGSGAQTRDEDVFGHKIFLVLADALSSRGIAVLRYDKRGVGGSSADFDASTSVDFAADVEAALKFMKTRPEVDPARIGLIGHSEGAAIAASVAVRNPAVKFCVLMAGAAMRLDRLAVLQASLISQAQGVPNDSIAVGKAFEETLYAELMQARTDEEALSTARRLLAQAVADKVLPQSAQEPTLHQVTSPWFRQALGYDPIPILRQLQKPVLALNGSLDLQVPAKENLALMRDALKGNERATIVELPNLNHMFQMAQTGLPTEYGRIEETISPGVLKLVTDWLAVAQ